jgi:hypothetical protein
MHAPKKMRNTGLRENDVSRYHQRLLFALAKRNVLLDIIWKRWSLKYPLVDIITTHTVVS